MAGQAEQIRMPGTTPTLLERVQTAIKLHQDERQEIEEAFTKAETKYCTRMHAIEYELETLRRMEKQLTNRE